MAVSSVRLFKSALKWYYSQHNVLWPASLNSECEKFLKGWTRIIALHKQQGTMRVFEGKHPLSFLGYWIIDGLIDVERMNGMIDAMLLKMLATR